MDWQSSILLPALAVAIDRIARQHINRRIHNRPLAWLTTFTITATISIGAVYLINLIVTALARP